MTKEFLLKRARDNVQYVNAYEAHLTMEDAYIEPELKVIVRSLKCVKILDSKK